ncbi:class I SAM-dependent methyltransferase [Scytonema sp. NUACC26]|uniref:class I SAM-dependent methyltransferase n=1 Tax=Scytonema sp. NUACC26 TaxID=3140176 RepID=UPI0034DBA69C
MTSNLNIFNPGASARSIQHHYDVSNEFFSLWLDPSLTYSSAMWEEGETIENFEKAQMRKLDYHIEQAKVKGAKQVLDVGCGWGSLLKRLVDVYDVQKVVGLSISQAHVNFVSAWRHPNIEARLESWSEHSPQNPYDGIISLEVFEHFARLELSSEEKLDGYRAFFSRCHDWLKPGGIVSIQTIVYENSTKEDFSQFFAEQVFPESDLARQSEIFQATDRLFEILLFRNYRHDYIRTLKAWLKNLKANRKQVVNIVGEEVFARYEKYLSMSLIAFHTVTTNVSCITMRRIDQPRK